MSTDLRAAIRPLTWPRDVPTATGFKGMRSSSRRPWTACKTTKIPE